MRPTRSSARISPASIPRKTGPRACRKPDWRGPATGKFAAEGWRVRKDGTLFWASVVIDAIHGDGGELLGYAKITRDETERRMQEQQLLRARK